MIKETKKSKIKDNFGWFPGHLWYLDKNSWI